MQSNSYKCDQCGTDILAPYQQGYNGYLTIIMRGFRGDRERLLPRPAKLDFCSWLCMFNFFTKSQESHVMGGEHWWEDDPQWLRTA